MIRWLRIKITVWRMTRRSWFCRAGLHNDGTSAFGGYSPVCLRCGKEI